MSLTISSNTFSAGYTPQLNSRVLKPQSATEPAQVKLLGNTDEDLVELSSLKSTPEENNISTENHNNFFNELNKDIPDPILPEINKSYGIMIAGIGGTGVVTIGAILGTAAQIDGKGSGVLDMTGLAQKGGSVKKNSY